MLKIDKLIEIFRRIEEAHVYGEKVKVFSNNEKNITIVINENSPDSGLTEYLYNESNDMLEDDWGTIAIGDIVVNWMTLPEEDF